MTGEITNASVTTPKDGAVSVNEADETNLLTAEEAKSLPALYRNLLHNIQIVAEPGDISNLRSILRAGVESGHFKRDKFGNSSFIRSLITANELCVRVSPDRNMAIAMLLYPLCLTEALPIDRLEKEWGEDIAKMVRGLIKVTALYQRGAAVE